MLHDSGKLPLVAPEWWVLISVVSQEPILFSKGKSIAKELKEKYYPNSRVIRVKNWVKLMKNG